MRPLFTAAVIALSAWGTTLAAQDTAAAGVRANDAEPLTMVEQWRENPAQVFDSADIEPDDFKWIARIIAVFAESPFDPNFQRQMENIEDDMDALVERDVLLVADTEPEGRSPLREKLRPRGFMMALVGKDGEVKLRKPLPWDVREISRSIDKMPLRQQEVRDARRAQ